MNPLKFIDPLIFLVSLCIGPFYTYITAPKPDVVIKYPTPFNAGKITYIDDAGVCYKYAVKKSSCPADKSQIKKVPIQEGAK